ncbi:Rab GTPase [Cavenderia fasciculata]|uniref:Ras-related protein Rab-7b n=1 Tax=Cavenderia fasciculata TaxID=261658 RepID=F4QED1_CACFS|nr:Rab GTPase [Cavenderia fasciculata]EGG14078.1 Rab GTPase [Cavenderia fasciculata]|eukprot:XP_004350786.1 Rab GTPase [Cavenderia fasciculata]
MDLLLSYKDDDDDSDSEQEDVKQQKQQPKKKQKSTIDTSSTFVGRDGDIPDLPLEIIDRLSNVNNSQDEDIGTNGTKQDDNKIDKHKGKKRQFEHVEGNYPTFVYFDVPIDRKDMESMIDEVRDIGNEMGIGHQVDHYHVSLSRVFPMREHHIDLFCNQLKLELKNIQKFSIQFESISTFFNDDKSRIFLSSNVTTGIKSVNRIIAMVDKCLDQFKFPLFHEIPLPHLSICGGFPSDDTSSDNNNKSSGSPKRDKKEKAVMAGQRRKVLKIVIIGEKSVGKTSILKRYVDQRFVPMKPTIGIDFVNKDVMVHDRLVTLQLWDTSGQERFRSLDISYYRGADCCVLVFDVTNEKSLQDLIIWRNDFIEKIGVQNQDTFPFVVLGNKVDEESRVVSEKQALNFVKQLGGNIFYFDTSAKSNINVEEAFSTVSRISLQSLEPDAFDEATRKPEKLSLETPKKDSPCCST